MKESLRILASTPWAIAEDMLPAVADILEFRAAGVALSAEEVQARIGSGMAGAKASQNDGIAVIPIRGVISPDADEYFGGVSPDQISAAIDGAMNANVGTIVLAIDSPGGSVYGVPEVAEKVREAASEKRVIAICTGMMASAAYYIGSAASQVISTPSGQVGSIGVFTMHFDYSRYLANEGINVEIIKAGKYKAEGHPFGPLTDDARDAAQARIDDYYDAFVTAVARHRGVSTAAVRTGFGEGRVENARAALKSGMVDRIGSLDAVLGELIGGKRKSNNGVRAVENPPPTALQDITILTKATPAGGLLISGPLTASTATAAGGPAAVLTITPSASAPKAKENTVPELDTAALNGADTGVSTLKAFVALAKSHGKDPGVAAEWFEAGKTLDQVRADILAEYSAGARPLRDSAADPTIKVGADREAAKPFASIGEQLQAVANVTRGKGTDADRKRLMTINAAVSGGSSAVGSDGGFLIQHQFTTDLVKDAFNEGALLSRCDNTEIGADSNGLKVVYIDETSRATGSRWGGVQVYNVDEAETVTAKKPKLGKWELDLGKKMGVAYATEELLVDAAAMGDVYSKAFSAEFAFKCDDEIFRGIGGAEFLGVKGGPSTVSVAKESGQLADTIVAENVMKMWARVHPRSKARGAWFVNPETSVQLHQLQIGTGTSATLVYLPPGGLSGQSYGTIFGRPVIETEYNDALGDKGDICFLDLARYKTITKGGIKGSESMHVRFLYDEMTFKWTFRINGAPKDKSALTPYKATSGATLSPFVFLDARA